MLQAPAGPTGAGFLKLHSSLPAATSHPTSMPVSGQGEGWLGGGPSPAHRMMEGSAFVKVASPASQPHRWSWGMGGCGPAVWGGVPQPLLTPWPTTQWGPQQALGRQDTAYLSPVRQQSGFYFNSPAEMSTHHSGAGGTADRAQEGAPPRALRTPPSGIWPGCTRPVGLERVCRGPDRGRVSENGLAEI